MIPDRLPEALRELIAKFPPGGLQFEVGIQTFDLEVSKNISRRQNYEKLADNFCFLREKTGVHIHADLIVGLPGESVESFAKGFDRLVAMRPQETQVGILKRLRGTPIVRHDQTWQMVYSPIPPYEILRNKLIDFATMQKMRRFAKFWDLIGNSGNFVETTPLIWDQNGSPFAGFMSLSEWLFSKIGRQHSIALARLAELLFQFLTERNGSNVQEIANVFWRDWQRSGRTEKPNFLRDYISESTSKTARASSTAPKRQARHLVDVAH
jgi:hypothetical protein